MVRMFLVNRPNKYEDHTRVLEVIKYDGATELLTVRGRFQHMWEMQYDYAREHYTPAKETDDAILARLQEELQARREDCESEGGATRTHAPLARPSSRNEKRTRASA